MDIDMITNCPACNAQFKLNKEKFGGKQLTLKCENSGNHQTASAGRWRDKLAREHKAVPGGCPYRRRIGF